jgi:hypothetical protein
MCLTAVIRLQMQWLLAGNTYACCFYVLSYVATPPPAAVTQCAGHAAIALFAAVPGCYAPISRCHTVAMCMIACRMLLLASWTPRHPRTQPHVSPLIIAEVSILCLCVSP